MTRGIIRREAAAVACPNIAFIKYWGNRHNALRLPANGSISMNLGGLETRTQISFRGDLSKDEVQLNGREADESARERVSSHLDILRNRAGISLSARVVSRNNFPMGAGIASSASGFAALTVAAAAALRMTLTERELSALARRGSGSASRSIPEGFAEWHVADTDAGSYAESIAPADHWELTDLIAVVSAEHKKFPSSEGNRLAESSPLQNARLTDTVRRLDICREALHKKEFATFASILEEDTLLMHAVMMTSSPSLVYFEGTTLEILRKVPRWRRQGLNVCFSVDAGPNVHCICLSRDAEEVKLRLRGMPQVQQVICAVPGPAAHLCEIEREELV